MLIIVVSSFSRTFVGALFPLFLYPLAILSLSEIPIKAVSQRVAWALPFVFFVAIWNPILETTTVHLTKNISVSSGWISGISIVIRSLLATSTIILLVACTGIPRLTQALKNLKMPNTLVMLFVLIYRFLFVIVHEAERLTRAQQLRSGKNTKTRPKQVARIIGVLLVRSVERSERIHTAMTARGFQNNLPLIEKERPLSFIDIAWLFAWLTFFVVCRFHPMFQFLNFTIQGTHP